MLVFALSNSMGIVFIMSLVTLNPRGLHFGTVWYSKPNVIAPQSTGAKRYKDLCNHSHRFSISG